MPKHDTCWTCHSLILLPFRSLSEALRKDPHSSDFLESLEDILPALAPVFDRAPKYAWIAKQLLEPERAIQFRVVRSAFEMPDMSQYEPGIIGPKRSINSFGTQS